MSNCKKCPFCNSHRISSNWSGGREYAENQSKILARRYCKMCGATGPMMIFSASQLDSVEELLDDNWNTRPQEDRIRAEIIEEIRSHGKNYMYNDTNGQINKSFDELLIKLSGGVKNG